MSAQTMPAAFLGHGSPMNTLETNRFTAAWRAFGESVPRPRAILVISAHWYINATAVTAMARPKTLHDFYGFPQALFDVQYPAPGLPELAEEISEIAKPTLVGADVDSWGLDHGTWSVLVHAFPQADIPVVQLSINALQPFDYHLELGARLAPLRERGVLIVGSGNVVHNLRAIDWNKPEAGFAWAQRVDERVRELMSDRPTELTSLASHQHFKSAVPTPEHFIPLLYLAGLSGAAATPTHVLVEGYAFGSLSMTAYTLGMDCPKARAAQGEGAAAIPSSVPWDESNV